jgi:hypothetical protein
MIFFSTSTTRGKPPIDNLIVKDSVETFIKQYGSGNAYECEVARLGQLYRDFRNEKFPKAEKVIFGASRGQVIMTIAGTNAGKTTFGLNLAVRATTGDEFLPFFERPPRPIRVMWVDGESTRSELQSDLRIMMRELLPMQRLLVDENLLIVCDGQVHGEPLNLSFGEHIDSILQTALEFKPDIIVVDTMAALFALRNENDNAEISAVVMQPLKNLAVQADAVVWLNHHTGKQSENAGGGGAYSARGGSNLGALSRAVLMLTIPDRTDRTRVLASMVKSKGFRMDDTLMRLDLDSRWFEVVNQIAPTTKSLMEQVVEYVTREMKAADIFHRFGHIPKRTIEDALRQAVNEERLFRPRKGYYAPVESTEPAEALGDCGTRGTVTDEVTERVEPEDFGLALEP